MLRAQYSCPPFRSAPCSYKYSCVEFHRGLNEVISIGRRKIKCKFYLQRNTHWIRLCEVQLTKAQRTCCLESSLLSCQKGLRFDVNRCVHTISYSLLPQTRVMRKYKTPTHYRVPPYLPWCDLFNNGQRVL